MTQINNEFPWIVDPGHEYLRVPRQLVINLGIADKISQCSFQSRDRFYAYLEGDCDAHVFYTAFKEKYGEPVFQFPPSLDSQDWRATVEPIVLR